MNLLAFLGAMFCSHSEDRPNIVLELTHGITRQIKATGRLM
jgi:hypothetical protein